MTPIDYFMKIWADLTLPDARKFLGRFGVTGGVQTTIMGNLSDGQKSRVVLAKMAKETPHLLFLDEPTNHLDMESIDSLAKAINGFGGGMVLVSHDMRLISQVAKEIWICDNRTVSKYLGEITDFKMHLRRQMHLQDGDGKVALAPLPVVPLTSKPLGTQSAMPPRAPQIAPKVAPAAGSSKAEPTEEEMILKARMELADLAIAKQRARKAAEAATTTATADTPVEELESLTLSERKESSNVSAKEVNAIEENELDEKALRKAKKKAEKEAEMALEKREEEERQARRELNKKDIADAVKYKQELEVERQRKSDEKAAKEVHSLLHCTNFPVLVLNAVDSAGGEEGEGGGRGSTNRRGCAVETRSEGCS